MKRLISILRHAKAEDDSDYTTDAERPLTTRGVEDAARMGAYLVANGMVPQHVLCSSAVRTRETLAALGVSVPTILTDKLYLASAGDMLGLLQQADDALSHVMIVGHNPGMHELVVRLMDEARDEADIKRLALKFPTCAFAQLSVELDGWSQLALHGATLEHYLIGKELPEPQQSVA